MTDTQNPQGDMPGLGRPEDTEGQIVITGNDDRLYQFGFGVAHSSDESGIPDVGQSLGLGDGAMLYVGDTAKACNIVVFFNDDRGVLEVGNMSDFYAAREFVDLLAGSFARLEKAQDQRIADAVAEALQEAEQACQDRADRNDEMDMECCVGTAKNCANDTAPIGGSEAAIRNISERLRELDDLCANAERRGPSHKGYVTDATYHTWRGQRYGLQDALRALSEEPSHE